MRQLLPPRRTFLAACGCGAAAVLLGAGPGKKPPSLKDEKPPKAEETVGDLAYVRMDDAIRVEGVGLVIGLNGTGSDPVPGPRRTALLDRMRKAQVPDAERVLESPNTSLVIVRGTIPVGVTSKDVWDIELEVDPASTTTSLEGGFLMMTPLTVVQLIDGRELEGQQVAEAYGPILTGSATKPDDLRAGRVLGGARAKKDLPYSLVLKEGRQGFRTADMLQKVVNLRFHQRKGIEQLGMAVAKTHEHLVLSVPRVYHHNQYRYFQVLQRLPMIDTPELRAARQERWAVELLDPATAGQAALKLEGIGRNAVEALKKGLASPSPQVRFFAAESLAYLNDPSGVDELARAAKDRPEFRAYALAALAALDQPASIMRLRELMSQAEPKLRYGAFDALRTLDPRDPTLGKTRLLRDEPAEPEPDDAAMQMRLYAAPRRKPRAEDPFDLYVVASEGPPLVHVARTRRREVVVFGRGQKLLTPLVLGGSGPVLLNAADNDRQVEISRIGTGEDSDLRITSSTELPEVLAALANLGATYPDVLAILQAADRQKNLAGPLVVDSLPEPLKEYDAAQLAGVDATKSKPKIDEALQKASGEKAEPAPRRRLIDRLRLRSSRATK
jgi:flagellar basal body P-ring protein FlgI